MDHIHDFGQQHVRKIYVSINKMNLNSFTLIEEIYGFLIRSFSIFSYSESLKCLCLGWCPKESNITLLFKC